MATNASISLEHTNGTITQIYCHGDGYINYVGSTLYNEYTEYAKIERLVALGNLSSLGSFVEPSVTTHSFNTPEDNVCVAYKRDRYETGQIQRTFANRAAFYDKCISCAYNYLYTNAGEWLVTRNSNSPVNWHSLKDVIEEKIILK